MPHQTLNTIAILSRDVIVGQTTLKLLLQSAGYNTRFMLENTVDPLANPLDGVGLLLLAPSLTTRGRENFLNGMRSTPATAKIPVLELVTSSNETQAEQEEGHVPWPCRIEDLKARIEAALSKDSVRQNGIPDLPSTSGGSLFRECINEEPTLA